MLLELVRVISLISENSDSRNKELWKVLYGKESIEAENFFNEAGDPLPEYAKIICSSEAYETIRPLSDNPNPKAHIAFLIQYPFQFYIYKNVYRHISEVSEFVIDAKQIRKNLFTWNDLLFKFGDFMRREKVFFRYFNDDKSRVGYVPEFFDKYITLISNYATGPLRLPCNRNKKKIRMMYGQSKDAYDFGPWLRHFDLSLNYGPYSQNLSAPFVNGIEIGNPKFDDWFHGLIVDKNFEVIKAKLDPSKKIVLYLPTHGNLASLEHVADQIGSIAKNYNIIIKPHHLTLYAEPGRKVLLEKYKSACALLVDDFSDVLSLLQAADVVLLDNSGAIFDAVLAEKPMAILDLLDREFFEKTQWDITKRASLSWSFPLTYEDSIEQRIKKESNINPGPIIRVNDFIEEALLRAIEEHKEKYLPAQLRIKNMLFSGIDGNAGKRAAQAILNIDKITQKKPFWAISVDVDMAREKIYNESKIDWIESNAEKYINLEMLDDIAYPSINYPLVFSVVVPTFGRPKYLAKLLKSLISQTADSRDFEIIVVDDGSPSFETKDKVLDFIKENPHNLIRYVRMKNNQGASVARNVGAIISMGEIVVFTDDDCDVPKNWLLTGEKLLKNNPEVAGVGGWRMPDKGNYTFYAQFIYHMEIRWLHNTKLGPKFFDSQAGDTASMFYKRNALMRSGGFNKYFRLPDSPCLEDWELKSRMHLKKLSLLYSPELLVTHFGQPRSFGDFVRHYSIRGWGYFLLSRSNAGYRYYDFTLMRTLSEIALDFKWIGASEVNFFTKIFYCYLAILKDIMIFFGKYYGVTKILRNREDP